MKRALLYTVLILLGTFFYIEKWANAMASTESKFESVNGRIAFNSDRGGVIFLLENGKIKKMVQNGGGWPRLSRQSNKVYYSRTGMILSYDIEKGISSPLEFIRMYMPAVGYDISPDEKQLLFLSKGNQTERNDPNNIFVINLDGTDLKQITFFEGRGPGYSTAGPEYPRWSPDGKWIAFEAPPLGKKNDFADTLYIMKTDGTNIRKVIGPESMAALAEFNWSPDSKSIAFTAIKEPAKADGTPGSPRQIYIINIDGSNLRRVTSGIFHCQQPDFSPDGKQLVYSSRRHPNQNIMGFGISGAELFICNLDGTSERRITSPQVVSRSGLGIFPWDKIYATDTHPDWA